MKRSGSCVANGEWKAHHNPNARYPPLTTRYFLEFRELADLEFVFREFEVVIDHDFHELLESYLRLPTELLLRFRRVADQELYFRGTLVTLIVLHVFLPIESKVTKRHLTEFLHTVRLVGAHHI